MKKLVFSVLFLSLVGALMVVPASADSNLYSNFPANSNFNAWPIYGTAAVTDLFTETYTGTVASATFEVWLIPGDSLSTVDWSLGTTQYGTDIGSGTASTALLYDYGVNSQNFDVVTESISGLDVPLVAGTPYYFTLTGATGDGIASDGAFWDENDGSSVGYASVLAGSPYYGSISAIDADPAVFNAPGLSGGETYALNGITPEPSSLLLLGSGLVGLAGLLKRKFAA